MIYYQKRNNEGVAKYLGANKVNTLKHHRTVQPYLQTKSYYNKYKLS
jgi:hypothetical protein